MAKRYTGTEIRASVARALKWLGLENWQVVVKVGRIAGGHRATCEADWSYAEATLRFDPVAMQKHGDDLDEICLHEAWHILVWRSHQEKQRLAKTVQAESALCALEEAETTDASRAFLRLAKEARFI